MDLLLGFGCLAVVLALPAAIWFVAFGSRETRKSREEAIAGAEATFDELFDAPGDVVTYASGPGAIPHDIAIRAADHRGFELSSQTVESGSWGTTHHLVFKRR